VLCGVDPGEVHRALLAKKVIEGNGEGKASILVKINGKTQRFYGPGRGRWGSETPLSDLQLEAEVTYNVAVAKKTFEALRHLPEGAVFDDRRLFEILADLDDMSKRVIFFYIGES
jgi:hypothetical protein